MFFLFFFFFNVSVKFTRSRSRIIDSSNALFILCQNVFTVCSMQVASIMNLKTEAFSLQPLLQIYLNFLILNFEILGILRQNTIRSNVSTRKYRNLCSVQKLELELLTLFPLMCIATKFEIFSFDIFKYLRISVSKRSKTFRRG